MTFWSPHCRRLDYLHLYLSIYQYNGNCQCNFHERRFCRVSWKFAHMPKVMIVQYYHDFMLNILTKNIRINKNVVWFIYKNICHEDTILHTRCSFESFLLLTPTCYERVFNYNLFYYILNLLRVSKIILKSFSCYGGGME